MNKGRLPSLDGLRAISIALVIACHAVKVAKAALGRLPYGMGMIEDWGSVGVTIFFVISGFLITTLLCEEGLENGRINLRAFYTRSVVACGDRARSARSLENRATNGP
jgi:peptidoglycan/LPS O-acetylase OafA/YrhL